MFSFPILVPNRLNVAVLQSSALCSGGHQLDLLELHSLDAEVSGHLDDLSRVDEIFGIGTEFFHARIKLAATHPLGYRQADLAFTVRSVPRTEITNYHPALPSMTFVADGKDPSALSRKR